MALTQVDQGLLGQYAQYTGFKNRIINGAMVIDQRNAGASVSNPASKQYVLDRWAFWTNGSGGSAAYTVQQSSTAPVGFSNSLLITQTASYSPTGSNYNIFAQYIEGYNVADLQWGTANAATVTLSFWVRSSLTGTFGGAISNASQARSYPFTYTISAANTWEYKTITIPGDTSGTWLTTNGLGLEVYWQLGVGSSYLGTAGAWAGATYLGATGATQITATNGATFYITGVQLEKGSTATSFDYRPYGTELQLCQRYYWQKNSDTSYAGIGAGVMNGASTARIFIPYPVPMRSSPTVSATSLSSFIVTQGTDLTPNTFTPYANTNGCMADIGTTTAGTTGRGAVLLFANLSTGSIQATAEL